MTREELEERADDCQMPEDYIGVAADILKHIEDKDWAYEVFDEGAEWAGNAEELLQYAAAAENILKDGDKAKELMEQAKGMCQSFADFRALADIIYGLGDKEAGAESYLQAADKCQTPLELLELGTHVSEKTGDDELVGKINEKATEKCKNAGDYANLAAQIIEKYDDREWAGKIFSQGKEMCKSGADYVSLAKAAMEKLEDKELALSLYSTAEQSLEKGKDLQDLAVSCSELLQDADYSGKLFLAAASKYEKSDEVVGLAESCIDTLKTKELGLQIYEKAEQLCSNHQNYQKLAESVLQKTEDKGVAAKYFGQAGKHATSAEQMVSVAVKLSDEIDDLPGALELLKLAEKEATTPQAFTQVGEAILKYAQDDTWKKEIQLQLEKRESHGEQYVSFMNTERECETPAGFRNLGAQVFSATEDIGYCRRLYEKAEDKSVFFDDFFNLGDSIHAHIKDDKWLRNIYERMLDKWSELPDVNEVTKKILKQVDSGKSWVEKIYQELEKRCSESSGATQLGTSVYKVLGDDDWAKKLYSQALDHAQTRHDLLSLAEAVKTNLRDDSWSVEIIRKSVELCRDRYDFCGVIKYVTGGTLKDENLLKTLHQDGEKKFGSGADLIHLAESVANNLGDITWAKRLYLAAQDAPDESADKYRLVESALQTIGERAFLN